MAASGMIETPRLIIEPFTPARLSERYVSWLNDPLVTRFSDQQFRQHSLDSCRSYLASFNAAPHYFWAIVAKDTSVGHIGTITAYLDEHHSVADVGGIIGEPTCWGRGYGREAWLGVCDYLLRIAGIRKVTSGTIAPNIGMLKVMERIGMVEDGRRLRHSLWNGQEVALIHMAFFRETWLARYADGPFSDQRTDGTRWLST